MTRVALLRHAPTDWNEAGRIQGRSDRPLSPAGIAAAGRWRLPASLEGWRVVASPLRRTRETARLMGLAGVAAEPRLMEMDWGAWSGRTLADLRAELGDAMAENEAAGLDFRPEGGESPREVCERLAAWLAEVAVDGRPVVAVTHRGVQRAALVLACGWDMRGKPPLRLSREHALMLEAEAGGVRLAEPRLLALEQAR